MGNVNMPEISRGRALAYVLAALALLAAGGRLLGVGAREDSNGDANPAPHAALSAEPEQVRELVVHVVGAVRRPGLYRLREGSRVDDAIERAGGPGRKAALQLVNLAAPIADGQQVVVPVRTASSAATGAASEVGAAASGAGGPAGGRVHLNSATVEELDELPGIGPVTAQKIVDYRTEKGAFSSVDELDAVPGIGPARLADLKALVDL